MFSVKREDGQGRLRTLHRNQLLPFTSLPAPVGGEPGQDPDIEMDDDLDIADERPEDLKNPEPEDFVDEPDDTHPQVYKTPMQRKPGEAGLLPPRRRPVRQRKPPAWLTIGEWVSK